MQLSLGRWRWVCILAIPAVQILLTTLPLRYFFSFLPPPLPYPLFFFFFLRTHFTTCQSSLSPSHILGAFSPLLFGHTTNVRIFAFEMQLYLRAVPFLQLITQMLSSHPQGVHYGALIVTVPFLRRILVPVIKIMYVCVSVYLHFCILINNPFSLSTSLIRMLIFNWLIASWLKQKLLPLAYLVAKAAK